MGIKVERVCIARIEPDQMIKRLGHDLIAVGHRDAGRDGTVAFVGRPVVEFLSLDVITQTLQHHGCIFIAQPLRQGTDQPVCGSADLRTVDRRIRACA
ncbi:Uncharacterised protein [Mycobacteroides abscessus subsp. abscessus]|nr:Uncharacterised protein [Mycobacteroides abscessus subsp. abscessus]